MKNLRILILEDEPLVVESLANMLGELGHTVAAAVDTGARAVDRARQGFPDVALLDIDVAGEMNGIEAGKRIREHTDVPIIYLTRTDPQQTFDQARLSGAHDYLEKPVDMERLRRSIELAVTNQRMKGQARQPRPGDDSILVPVGGKRKKRLKLYDVLYLKAGRSYCEIHLSDGKKIELSVSLKTFFKQIEDHPRGGSFMRIHRSHAINTEHISEILGNMLKVGEEWLEVSDPYREAVKGLF